MEPAQELKKLITSILISSTQKSTIKQLSNDFINTVGYPIPFRAFGFKNVEEYLRSIPDIVKVNGNGALAEVTPIIQAKSAHINELVAKQRKNPNASAARRRSFRPQSGQNRSSYSPSTSSHYNPPLNKPTTISQGDTSQPVTRVFRSEFTSKIPREIQNNLRKLFTQFPQGINCGKILTEYRKLFRREIIYEKFNCRSVIELISELPEIFHYAKLPEGDYWVCEVNIPLPDFKKHEKSEGDRSAEKDTKDCLQIDWAQIFNKIPSDVMTLSDVIPRYFPSDLKEKDYLKISIGEMYNPSNFWVYLSPGPLDDLMKEMQAFYKDKSNGYLISQSLITEGLYCAVLHKGKYRRGVTVKTLPKFSQQVMVLFIDYGTVGNINLDKIYFLPKKFGKVPSQAIKAQLSNVFPLVSEGDWTLDCMKQFRKMITNKSFIAELMNIDEEAKMISIYLADITEESDIFYINEALVKEGHAIYYDDVKEQISKLELDDDEDSSNDYQLDGDDW